MYCHKIIAQCCNKTSFNHQNSFKFQHFNFWLRNL